MWRWRQWRTAHSGLEPRSPVVWKWHSCPCKTGLDWTTHWGMSLSLALSIFFSISLWCLVLLSSVLGKHLLSILWEFIKACRSLWLPLFHLASLWLLPLSLSIWCVNTDSFRFDRLTRIHGKTQQTFHTRDMHLWTHAHDSTMLHLHTRQKKPLNLKDYCDKLGIPHVCRHKHTLHSKLTYCHLNARMKHRAVTPACRPSVKETGSRDRWDK